MRDTVHDQTTTCFCMYQGQEYLDTLSLRVKCINTCYTVAFTPTTTLPLPLPYNSPSRDYTTVNITLDFTIVLNRFTPTHPSDKTCGSL